MTVGKAGSDAGPIRPVSPGLAAPAKAAPAPTAEPPSPAKPQIPDLVQWHTPGVNVMPTARTLMAFVEEPPPAEAPPKPDLTKPETPVPLPLRQLSASGDETGVDIATSLDPAGQVRAAMHVAADGTGRAEPGALTVAEAKAGYVAMTNVAGTGVALAVDRSSTLSVTPNGAATAEATGKAAVRHDEHVAVSRSLAVFGHRADTTLQADYSVGVTPTRISPEAGGKWVDQAVSVGVKTAPVRGVTVGVGTDLPLGASLGGRSDLAVKATMTVPYVSVGTTQTPEAAHYDANIQGAAWGVVALSAGGAVDHDKSTGNVALSGQLLMKLQL